MSQMLQAGVTRTCFLSVATYLTMLCPINQMSPSIHSNPDYNASQPTLHIQQRCLLFLQPLSL
jgi:hypothetical protein